MMHQSIATLSNPEFINLQPHQINPLMSECEIKVFYLGANRNHSFITKEVALEMAKTLRGAPIVGQYRKDIEDFGDHGETIIFDEDGIKFGCETVPYGFVAPTAEVWFQTFEEQDDKGQKIIREYLMTTGYLWTGQFEECKKVIQNGKSQSMELDEKSLDGYWSKEIQQNVDFFIINDAIFSKLCILGDAVEPCFEGASVKGSRTYNMDDTFKNTLFSMMNDLQNLQILEGGQTMVTDKFKKEDEKEKKEPVPTPEEKKEGGAPVPASEKKEEEKPVPAPADEKAKEEEEEKKPATSHKKEDEEEKKEEKPSVPPTEKPAPEKEEEDEEKKKAAKNTCKDDEEKKKYSLELEALQAKYAEAQAQIESLMQFKNSIEEEKKTELISSFYMLSDEDKKEVIENKNKYSYDDIKAKLAIMCVDKKVSFAEEAEEKSAPMQYSLDVPTNDVPAWIAALRNQNR